MTGNPYLERNQSVLWARDILLRQQSCLLIAGSTTADGSVDQDGQIVITDLSGKMVLELTVSTVLTDSSELLKTIEKKELLLASIPRLVLRIIETSGNSAHDTLSQYRHFIQDEKVQFQPNLNGSELAKWVQKTVSGMAGTSLHLDQADTGAGKWTAAQFKPNATMLAKFKSMLKG